MYSKTFIFRERLPGMEDLVIAINKMLDSGAYQFNFILDAASPRTLEFVLFEFKNAHPTISLKFPLADNTSEFEINELVQQFASKNRAGLDRTLRLLSNDTAITFITIESFNSASLRKFEFDDSKLVHEHTFLLRKITPGMGHLFDAISVMVNKYRYGILASVDSNNHRWLQFSIYLKSSLRPVLVFSRRLKSSKKEDSRELSKINFAWAHEAVVMLSSSDDINIHISIGEPSSPTRLHYLLSAFQLL